MKNILVVGADRGIAHELCQQLNARGDHVLAACMGVDVSFTDRAIDVIGGIDVTSGPAVSTLVTELKARALTLDWLLHVAGVLGQDELGKLDYNDVRRQFEINTIGPLRVVESCVPFLRAGSKIGIVTSRVGSLTDNGSGGMYAYRVSKCGANMVALNLHHDLSKRGIAVAALHPGMVATDLTKGFQGTFIQPAAAAHGLIARMDQLDLASSGQFRHANGERLPW